LLGEASPAGFALEARNSAAVSGSRVGTVPFIEKPASDDVLKTFWPGAVPGAELAMRDVLNGSARPLHVRKSGK
jgi:hypothetical protein